MKKIFKLLLMIFLGLAGICFAGIAVYGALYQGEMTIPGHHWWRSCIYSGGLAVWFFIWIKKVYDSWYD